MTDNEIIKALECCIGWQPCKEKQCPMVKECNKDIDSVYKYALDLINRQKAEIERLTAVVDKTDAAYFRKVDEVQRAKAEAIKEFAESQHVVELPVMPGDDLYWIDDETMKIECQPHGIEAVVYYGNGKFKIVDDGEIEDVGGQWTLLSREDAEMFLRKKLKRSDEVGRSQVD